jgi:hypothetical protein
MGNRHSDTEDFKNSSELRKSNNENLFNIKKKIIKRLYNGYINGLKNTISSSYKNGIYQDIKFKSYYISHLMAELKEFDLSYKAKVLSQDDFDFIFNDICKYFSEKEYKISYSYSLEESKININNEEKIYNRKVVNFIINGIN